MQILLNISRVYSNRIGNSFRFSPFFEKISSKKSIQLSLNRAYSKSSSIESSSDSIPGLDHGPTTFLSQEQMSPDSPALSHKSLDSCDIPEKTLPLRISELNQSLLSKDHYMVLQQYLGLRNIYLPRSYYLRLLQIFSLGISRPEYQGTVKSEYNRNMFKGFRYVMLDMICRSQTDQITLSKAEWDLIFVSCGKAKALTLLHMLWYSILKHSYPELAIQHPSFRFPKTPQQYMSSNEPCFKNVKITLTMIHGFLDGMTQPSLYKGQYRKFLLQTRSLLDIMDTLRLRPNNWTFNYYIVGYQNNLLEPTFARHIMPLLRHFARRIPCLTASSFHPVLYHLCKLSMPNKFKEVYGFITRELRLTPTLKIINLFVGTAKHLSDSEKFLTEAMTNFAIQPDINTICAIIRSTDLSSPVLPVDSPILNISQLFTKYKVQPSPKPYSTLLTHLLFHRRFDIAWNSLIQYISQTDFPCTSEPFVIYLKEFSVQRRAELAKLLWVHFLRSGKAIPDSVQATLFDAMALREI